MYVQQRCYVSDSTTSISCAFVAYNKLCDLLQDLLVVAYNLLWTSGVVDLLLAFDLYKLYNKFTANRGMESETVSCGHFNRPHYGSYPFVRLSVCYSCLKSLVVHVFNYLAFNVCTRDKNRNAAKTRSSLRLIIGASQRHSSGLDGRSYRLLTRIRKTTLGVNVLRDVTNGCANFRSRGQSLVLRLHSARYR